MADKPIINFKIPFDGKLITSVEPTLVGKNFRKLQNMRYVGQGTNPRGIPGMEKIGQVEYTYVEQPDCNDLVDYLTGPHSWVTVVADSGGNVEGSTNIGLFGNTIVISYRNTSHQAKIAISQDLGLTWSTQTVPTMVVEDDLATHFYDVDNWYLWSFGSGKYWFGKTDDGGLNWTVVEAASGEYYYGAVAIQRVAENELIATSSASVFQRINIFSSSNDGASWSRWDSPFYPNSNRAFLRTLDNNNYYLATWAAAGRLVMGTSSDGGLNWDAINFEAATGASLYMAGNDSNRLFITHHGYYGTALYFTKTTDSGVSWSTYTADATTSHNETWMHFCGDIVYLAVHVNSPYAVPESSYLRMPYSLDEGVTWTVEEVDSFYRHGGVSIVSNFTSIFIAYVDDIRNNLNFVYLTNYITPPEDEFTSSTQQDFKSGGDGAKLYNWSIVNSANVDSIDSNITNAGKLTINSSATNCGFWDSDFSGVFIYEEITANFDVSIYISNENVDANYESVGLMVRDPLASVGEDWQAIFIKYSGNKRVEWDRTSNNTSYFGQVSYDGSKYFRIRRAGINFYFYSKVNVGDAWTLRSTEVRSEYTDTIQVGIALGTGNTSNNLEAQIDYIRFIY